MRRRERERERAREAKVDQLSDLSNKTQEKMYGAPPIKIRRQKLGQKRGTG